MADCHGKLCITVNFVVDGSRGRH